MSLFVYILKCSDDSYYTGITSDIEKRFAQHQNGNMRDSYTYDKRPVTLVFIEEFMYYDLAIKFEKQIKGWSRKKKEALIARDWEKIQELARCKNLSSHILRKTRE